jgi:hypothetical protein
VPNPVSYAGRGTQLLWSTDGVTYLPMPQLDSFDAAGSKQIMVDQTNLATVGNYTTPRAVQIDAGEFDFSGVLNPEDPWQQNLQNFHANLTLAWWQVVLLDGSTFNFQAYVSEYRQFQIRVTKRIRFSGKLRVVGGLIAKYVGFQPNAFQNSSFQIA